ncbi:MAG: flagellar basal-body rod protein FlgF [Paracoccaceae bacterium]|nr:flagellar basal-body rod protein FlgF [Paracoccaceae bacterium]
MDNSTYISLSLATALRRELDVTANNMANASTAGFKGERVVFSSYLHRDTAAATGDTSFLIDRGSYVDQQQGAITLTGNMLDVALKGEGWFGYETPQGQRAYGRDGHFAVDAQGALITMSGARVLDLGGNPINLPPDALNDLSISRNGTISSLANGVISQIGVFTLPDVQSYERIGNGMFIAPDLEGVRPALPDTTTEVVQGAIEGSNVQPVVEMTRMMSIQKAYERAVELMNGEDDLRRDMLRRVGRPPS